MAIFNAADYREKLSTPYSRTRYTRQPREPYVPRDIVAEEYTLVPTGFDPWAGSARMTWLAKCASANRTQNRSSMENLSAKAGDESDCAPAALPLKRVAGRYEVGQPWRDEVAIVRAPAYPTSSGRSGVVRMERQRARRTATSGAYSGSPLSPGLHLSRRNPCFSSWSDYGAVGDLHRVHRPAPMNSSQRRGWSAPNAPAQRDVSAQVLILCAVLKGRAALFRCRITRGIGEASLLAAENTPPSDGFHSDAAPRHESCSPVMQFMTLSARRMS